MAALASIEKLAHASLLPAPDPTDSDDVATALETARALAAQGEIAEAARWLRRAADEAEQNGHDDRVLMFARAAADLTSTIPSTERRSIQVPTPKPAPWSVSSPPAAKPSAPPPVPPRTSASPPPPPARASAPPSVSPRSSA